MCIFCDIASKKIPSKMVLEEDDFVAFHDTRPVAPTHVLIVPKRHIIGLAQVTPEDHAVLGRILAATKDVAEKTGILESGFRVVVNSGPDAGQSVYHLHVHVIGGRAMSWPPG
ncbi:MAG: histidine triad nucleotide-binding protein [Polyangiaceae bacterium]|nr:histidine triad nucleotide-binding protein [Polyangiaceae bacterium]